MTRIHLVLLWHMHQPDYRDSTTGRYALPWTRLHALKDYWGMVKLLEEFPEIHVTFNLVPSLGRQIEEYATGKFDEPWFRTAFTPAEELTNSERQEILLRAFQVNHEHLMSRWPRFVELYWWTKRAGAAAAAQFGTRDWRDLQMLSQLAWMDEEYLEHDPIVAGFSARGKDFTEEDKEKLRRKQAELLANVLPEYRRAAERGQAEISATPYYHPILPLLCDSQIAVVANPCTPPAPPFRHPEDAREQLARARRWHERLFGRPPEGLWPSEGSVSDEALGIAAELGFRWFASDEGVLGRTRNIAFWRDASGFPENAGELYTPWKFRLGGRELSGIFRDHYLSDLIGFVYSRMDAAAAAEDFHRRLRAIGERWEGQGPATVCVILDGENAWEYYPGNGREFLRQLYRRVERDAQIRALTVSEAVAAAENTPTLEAIFPGSWINANFDIWIGHAEDVRAWELLCGARQTYCEALKKPGQAGLERAYESLLAAEGSDWCWWFGPEHASANDAEFDELYRKHLSEVYLALGQPAPDALAHPIKKIPRRARAVPPSDWLEVAVDGRESSYFEWLGAGSYASERRSGAMHGQAYFLGELYYGFNRAKFFVRVDPLPGALEKLEDCEVRLVFRCGNEVRLALHLRAGKLVGYAAESNGGTVPAEAGLVSVAVEKIIEVSVARRLFPGAGQAALCFGVALWRGGLPVDLLPAEGMLEAAPGEEAYAWSGSENQAV